MDAGKRRSGPERGMKVAAANVEAHGRHTGKRCGLKRLKQA